MPQEFVARIIKFMKDYFESNNIDVDKDLMDEISKYKNVGATRQIQIMLAAYKGREANMAHDIYSKFYELDDNFEFKCMFANETDGIRKILVDDLRQCYQKQRDQKAQKLKNPRCKPLSKAIARAGMSSALATFDFDRDGDVDPVMDFTNLQKAVMQAKKFCSSKCSNIEGIEEFRACIDSSICAIPSDVPLAWVELRQLALMRMLLLLDQLIKIYFNTHLSQFGGNDKGVPILILGLLTLAGIICSVFTAGACTPMAVLFGVLLFFTMQAGGGDGDNMSEEEILSIVEKYAGKTSAQRAVFSEALSNALVKLNMIKDDEIDITTYFIMYLSERLKLDNKDVVSYYEKLLKGDKFSIAGSFVWKGIGGLFCRKPVPWTYDDIMKAVSGVSGRGIHTVSKQALIKKIESILSMKGGMKKRLYKKRATLKRNAGPKT